MAAIQELRDVARGVMGLAVIVALVAGLMRGWDALPWAWILGLLAIGLLLSATLDVVAYRQAKRRLEAIERFEDTYGQAAVLDDENQRHP